MPIASSTFPFSTFVLDHSASAYCVVRPKFVRKDRRPDGETDFLVAQPLELPIAWSVIAARGRLHAGHV